MLLALAPRPRRRREWLSLLATGVMALALLAPVPHPRQLGNLL